MIQKANKIADLISGDNRDNKDALRILPSPDIDKLKHSGAASIDCRLGCWFGTMRRARIPYLDIKNSKSEFGLIKHHYIHFGSEYYLHPHSFVLGVTYEWFKLPSFLAAYVIGKSSWGRRGLLIATAAGVHPGFSGCITLEITNVAEVPIAIRPGMTIGQLFFHEVDSGADRSAVNTSTLAGSRRPILGEVKEDEFASKLRTAAFD